MNTGWVGRGKRVNVFCRKENPASSFTSSSEPPSRLISNTIGTPAVQTEVSLEYGDWRGLTGVWRGLTGVWRLERSHWSMERSQASNGFQHLILTCSMENNSNVDGMLELGPSHLLLLLLLLPLIIL